MPTAGSHATCERQGTRLEQEKSPAAPAAAKTLLYMMILIGCVF